MGLEDVQRPGAAALAQTAPAAESTRFGAYLFAHASWFLAFGVQMVLFPYLVRVVLQENEVRFGLAQMAVQLPTTLLILFGGFVADRLDTQRILVTAIGATVFTFLALGAMVSAGVLTYELLIAYALIVGALGAFAMPARDALLSQVAPAQGGVQRAVAFASMAQFLAQIAGMILAALAPFFGVGTLLLGQGVLMAAATAAAARMRPRKMEGARRRIEGGPLSFMAREIGGGLSAAARSPVIGPVILCSVGMGACFMGAFAVLLPLVVQSYFPPDLGPAAQTQIASALGVFALCFWVGSTLSAFALIRIGPLRRKGAVYLGALIIGCFVLSLCALPMPLWLLCALNFVWGTGGGVAMTLGRGLVQEHAPEDKRARVLSIFSLGLMGGAPIGAVFYGYLAHAIGARPAILIPAFGMLAVTLAVAAFSKLRHVEDEPRHALA